MESEELARKRAQIIIKVQSGQLTATEAARQLGISRKAYYKWEQRGLQALIRAVEDRPAGRPSKPADPEKEVLAKSLSEVERQLLLAEQRAEIRDYFISASEKAEMDRLWEIYREKNGARKRVVTRMEHLKTANGIPYKMQCRSTAIPYSSLMRWRSRIRAGQPPTRKPGPRPVGPLDLADLRAGIIDLHHCRKRTLGTGALYRSVSDGISLRDFQTMVSAIRTETMRNRRRSHSRLTWHVPGMVWAFDDMEYIDPGFSLKHHVHSIRDLSSRFILYLAPF